ncbi:MAG: tetratricopeptide repeat protein [Magnetococcales bacterium]|nr:tetratricopeptide repeat protein [Magnetococcales bacterium]
MNNQTTPSLYKLGRNALENKRPKKAVHLFQQAIQKNSQQPLAWCGLGLGLVQLNQWSKAEEILVKAHKLFPNHIQIGCQLAQLYIRGNQTKKATRLLMLKDVVTDLNHSNQIARQSIKADWLVKHVDTQKSIQDLRKLLRIIDRPLDPEQVIEQSMIANYLFPNVPWRERVLVKLTEQGWSRWVTVRGFDHFEKAVELGRGVLLARSHFIPGYPVTLLMSRRGYPTSSIEISDRLKKWGLAPPLLKNTVFVIGEGKEYLGQLHQAGQVLRDNGVLMMAGDAVFGKSGISLPFLDRTRLFMPGMATLAVDNGATTLAVFSNIDEAGHITITFHPPFDPEQEGQSRKVKIQALMKQYADLLQSRWIDQPHNLGWFYISQFFNAAPYSS